LPTDTCRRSLVCRDKGVAVDPGEISSPRWATITSPRSPFYVRVELDWTDSQRKLHKEQLKSDVQTLSMPNKHKSIPSRPNRTRGGRRHLAKP
jgi:hypothetical protein